MSIAVIIPLFNHEDYVREAVESVLAQTLRVQRIIVVDDGSSDGSAAVVRTIDDDRIELLTQANAGAHAALNRGIELAERDCEFIAILNSDDVYERDRLERCVKFLQENKRIDLVATRLRMIDEDSCELQKDDPKARWVERLWAVRRPDLCEWLGIANVAKTSSNFVGRAPFFAKHGFRPYRYVHDYFLVVAAALENKFAILPQALLRYRTHPANTIKSGTAENVPREMLAMNLELFREFAPALVASAQARGNYVRYFRSLSQNYADFRAEVFLAAAAGLARGVGDDEFLEMLATITSQNFPELKAPKSNMLREDMARVSHEKFIAQIAGSRWMALGRLLGFAIDLFDDAPTPEERLSTLQKRCAKSRWFRLGQRLNLAPELPQKS